MLAAFVVFEAALLALLVAAPQFDTSSQLLVPANSALERLAQRLVTWDNLYYLTTAQRGVRYEHEYAFSQAWSAVIRAAARPLFTAPTLAQLALVAAGLALTAHLLACLLLPALGRRLNVPGDIAQLAGYLYIISPAGIFLSAGYPEAPFALLSFLGLYLFYGHRPVLAGAVLGVTVLLRSNGLLWGLLFADGALRSLFARRPARLAWYVAGGLLVGAGFLVPQALAWREMCPGRPWCTDRVPLLYSYVQRTYWNNGFLRYWTPNNIPNFLFAAPTLVLLGRSLPSAPRGLAAAQFALLAGMLLFWHVQVVTRVASCLPTPYLYVADLYSRGKAEGRAWVAYFVIWSLTQAVLFGAFLPPA